MLKNFLHKIKYWPAILLLVASPLTAGAQEMAEPSQAPSFSQEQLDQLLAPVALYPDSLLGQILMASTYPLEVVEAERWQQDPSNASLAGDDLAAAAEQQPWDPSVKSLLPFPQVLKLLNQNLQWTEQLGEAFLAQQPEVMDSVQRLRQRAESAGTLASTPQEAVSAQDGDIVITPINPQVVYVPYYNPLVVYGAWPYPSYQPYYFPPPDAFAYNNGVIGFSVGVAIIAPLWGWNHWDWHHHGIHIDDRRYGVLNNGHPPARAGVWEHDPSHRHDVPYRTAPVRQRFQGARTPEAQQGFRGYTEEPAPVQRAPERTPERTPAAAPDNSRDARRLSAPMVKNYGRENQPRGNAVSTPHVVTAAPEARRQQAPLFESFSRGSEVRAQEARGAASRAPAPRPAARPAEPPRGGGEHGGGGHQGGGGHDGADNNGNRHQ